MHALSASQSGGSGLLYTGGISHLTAPPSNTQLNNMSSGMLQNDSTALSGAVGTALYVAPELLVPQTQNKFYYTQVLVEII